MNDIDRLETDIVDLQKAVYLISDRLSTQSQDMAALRKRIEALEERLTGLTLNVDAFVREFREEQDALNARVVTLEGQGNRVGGTVPESSAVTSASPTPPAPLVERMCLIFHKQQSPTYPARCEMAKEALLVAAEELLEPITGEEMDVFDSAEESSRQGIDRVLRRRLARAKEAARG